MFNKENKPKIRFPEFTDDWKQRKLSEICNSISSSLTIKDVEEKGVANLYDANGIIGKTNKNIQATDYITIIKDGAGVGRVRLLSKNTSFIGTMVAITTNSNSLKYIYYLIQKINFKKYIKTGTIPHIYFKEYGNEQIKIPSVGEQQKIADFIFSIDTLISNYQSKLDNIKSLKKAFMQRVFPKKDGTNPEIRFLDFNDEWKKCKLGKKIIYKNGKGYECIQSNKGKYELINLNSISIDGGLKSSGKFIEDETETLKKNDLVMVLSDIGHGDLLGRVAIIPEDNKFVLNQRVALLRINDNTNPQFLFSLINSKQDYFKKEGAGSSQLNLSKTSVENFIVSYPSLDEQIKIGEFFSNFNVLIFSYHRKLGILENIKKGLLQQMFV